VTHKLQQQLFGSDMSICDGPWEARKGVRAQLRRDADVVHVMATGGVLSKYDNPHHQEFTNEEMDAIVHEASLKGRAVAAHCHGEAGIRTSLEAGALTVEHGTYISDQLCDMMLEKGALLVPTLYVARRLLEVGEKSGMMPESVTKLRRIAQDHSSSIRLALRKGVRIACGTDIYSHGERSPVPWGEHAKELEVWLHSNTRPPTAWLIACAFVCVASGRGRNDTDASTDCRHQQRPSNSRTSRTKVCVACCGVNDMAGSLTLTARQQQQQQQQQ
jgi:hypothetical protein